MFGTLPPGGMSGIRRRIRCNPNGMFLAIVPVMLTTYFSTVRCRLATLVASAGFALALPSCSGEPDPSAPRSESPPVSVEVIRPLQLTDAARLPEQDPNLSRVEVEVDQLRLYYDKAPTLNFDVGNVVGGVLGGGYIRRVTQLTTDGTVVTASTKPAELVEFIRDGAFRVRQVPAADDWTTGKQASALEVRVPLLDVGGPVTCAAGTDALLEVEPVFDLLDADLDVAVDIKPDAQGNRGKLEHARYVFSGSVEAGVKASYVGSLVGACELDIGELVGKKLGVDPEIKLAPIRFAVGPVPVVITHSIQPTLKLEGEASVNAKGIEVSYLSTHDLKVGTEYRDGKWQDVWDAKRSGSIDASIPSEVESVSGKISLWSGLEYSAYLYDLAGPKIGAESGLNGTLSAELETCRWNAELNGDVRASLSGSVKVPVIGHELFEATGYWNLVTAPLGSDAGDLPEWLCSPGSTPKPPPKQPPTGPNDPPPGVPPDALTWWATESTSSTTNSDGSASSSSYANVTVWTALSGWSHESKHGTSSTSSLPSGSSAVSHSVTTTSYNAASKTKTTSSTTTTTITNYNNTGETYTDTKTSGPTSVSCAKGCPWAGLNSPGHDFNPNPVPKAPYCTAEGEIVGYDGGTYTTSKTLNGSTTTGTYKCSNCGGRSTAGCSCTAQGVQCS